MADRASVTYSRSDNQTTARTILKNSSFSPGTMPTCVQDVNSFPVQLQPNSDFLIKHNFLPNANLIIILDLNQITFLIPIALGRIVIARFPF